MNEIQIELLLAMKSPSGSTALLFTHFWEWRLSLTTFIVMLYLLMNITGRFSVAIFGLTYNLVDGYSKMASELSTNWTSSVLLAKNATDFDIAEERHSKDPTLCKNIFFSQQLWLTLHAVSYLDLVRGGLATLGHLPDIGFDISAPQNLTAETLHSLRINSSLPVITGGNAVLAYGIRDFLRKGRSPIPSSHVVHSSASCTMFRVDANKYWKDYEGGDQSSKGMSYESLCWAMMKGDEAYRNRGNRLDRRKEPRDNC